MAKRPTARSKDPDAAAPAEPKPTATRARAAKPAAAEQNPAGPPPIAGPTDEDIRRRAYERYQKRGGNHGQHFDDWLEAEKELRTKK